MPNASLRRPFTSLARLSLSATALVFGIGVVGVAPSEPQPGQLAEPPRLLSDTGLYAPDSTTEVRAANLPFTPQYPLWSDGASKRHWLYLPPGTSIDASRPDAWDFPRGTRVWKEFAYGRPVETRYIERRADGSWLYATYVWNDAGSDAVLAPAAGVRSLPVAGAPGERYEIPARFDCLACHEGAAAPLLGVSALQLSPDRDPLAAHGASAAMSDVDLSGLVARGRLRHLPAGLLGRAPRIVATSPSSRAALGYLHGNCGHCHNHNGAPAPVRLTLAQSVESAEASSVRVLSSVVGAPSRYRVPGAASATTLVEPGRPEASVLALRMRSRQALMQMPPLGSRHPDAQGLALIERWITHDLSSPKEPQP